MAAGAQRNLQNTINGLLQRDKQLCNQAIADDEDEDQLEIQIDSLGLQIIVRFQPVATDLRMVIGAMKTATNLERISDQAVSIAKRSRKMLKNDDRARSIEDRRALPSRCGHACRCHYRLFRQRHRSRTQGSRRDKNHSRKHTRQLPDFSRKNSRLKPDIPVTILTWYSSAAGWIALATSLLILPRTSSLKRPLRTFAMAESCRQNY